jgi:preprotein translocase subunit SecA
MSKHKPLGLSRRKTRTLVAKAEEVMRKAKETELFTLSNEALVKSFSDSSCLTERLTYSVIAASRSIKLTPYTVQVLGALALTDGCILEMNTGEGKTLTAALAAATLAYQGTVHIATANEYLAVRDAEIMSPLFAALGLSVSAVTSTQEREEKRAAYACNIVYSTATALGFDYLSDQIVPNPSDCIAPASYSTLLVDEADSLMIDEATTPLILGAPVTGLTSSVKLVESASKFVASLDNEDVSVEMDMRNVTLTTSGMQKYNEYDFDNDSIGTDVNAKKTHTEHLSSNLERDDLTAVLRPALLARFVYQRDIDYLVVGVGDTGPGGTPYDQPIVMIDHSTGRVAPDRRMSDGLHEAIEAHERLLGNEVPYAPVSVTRASITLPSFFLMYDRVCGMTGTASTDADEFARTYNTPVVTIPPNLPSRRIDLPERVFATAAEKYLAILEDIATRHLLGQPVLVGCESVDEAELLSVMLSEREIEHSTLHARKHEEEASVIAKAGTLGAVTIATTMAGRGVDILLGGKKDELGAIEKQNIEGERVDSLGGLAVIATTRFPSRRVDKQLRGRSGRQGDPGVTVGYVSLQDSLLTTYAGETLASSISTISSEKNGEITQLPGVRSIIERAQIRQESLAAASRSSMLNYDLPLQTQRNTFYKYRSRLMSATADEIALSVLQPTWNSLLGSFNSICSNSLEKTAASLGPTFAGKLPNPSDYTSRDSYILSMSASALTHLDTRFAVLGANDKERARLIRAHLLSCLDRLWAEHLEKIERLRGESNLASYAQSDPRDVFAEQARQLFEKFVNRSLHEMSALLNSLELKPISIPTDETTATGESG